VTWNKTFHRIWIPRDAEDTIPEKFEEFWARLQELHPDWKFRTWDDPSKIKMQNRAEFDAATTAAGKADVLRYEILFRFGGCYIDTDVEPLRSFDELLADERPFVAWEDANLLCPTVMGAPKGSPAVRALLDALPLWFAAHPNDQPNMQTGPYFLTEQWRFREDVRRLPPITFYPIPWWEKERIGGPYPAESYSAHHWAAGWKPEGSPVQPAATVVKPVGKVSILVPFRAEVGDATRTVAWEWVRRRWEHMMPSAEIVVGIDDGGEPFSKTTAVNEAYSRATGDVFIVADADAWMEADRLERGLAQATTRGRLVVPWGDVLRVSEESSRMLLALDPAGDLPFDQLTRETSSPRPLTAGTIFMITREGFETVNGMDPRLRGWGHEDISFRRCCDVIIGKTMYLQLGRAYTLWHPRPVAPKRGRIWGPLDEGRMNGVLNNSYSHAEKSHRREMEALVAQHPLGGAPAEMIVPREQGRQRSSGTLTEKVWELPQSGRIR